MAEQTHESSGHGTGGHKSHAPHGGGHEEGHEGAPEWLISFADNVALMMGFFVVLLAMNMAKQTAGGIGGSEEMGGSPSVEMLDFTIGMREAFNNPVSIDSQDPLDQPLVRRLIERAGTSQARDPGLEGSDHDVQSLRPSMHYGLGGSVPFAETSTQPSGSARGAIGELAGKIRGRTQVVEIRGHASSAEAAGGPAAAMRLSFERAVAVADALAAEGIDWWQMRLVICGDHERVAAFPSSAATDSTNARVEVVLTDESVPDRVPTRHEPPADTE
jgi:outer membrane protein OmpA-like peptidoglycan-associated protein